MAIENFDDAKNATQEIFQNVENQDGELNENNTENENNIENFDRQNPEAEIPPASEGEQNNSVNEKEGGNDAQGLSESQKMLAEASNTAETAANLAAQKDMQLKQAMAEIEEIRKQNEVLQGEIDELSKKNEENIVEDIMSPPVLDVNALAFADEDTVRAAQAKYAQDMAKYSRENILKELAPVIEQANEAKFEKEKKDIISALSQLNELSDIESILPQLDRIISNNKALSSDSVPLDEKYITAYAIAKGVNSMNTPPQKPKELTADDLMELYNKNPAFQELVEKQRIEQLKDSQQVPPFSASSGAVNAALNIKEKPKTFDEASKRTREMFANG